ncbi:MAG TPA: alpha/beta hydrolase [Polyangiaceae bacterium]|nr:alpha/beta hydrolase [Polyangiaceae bacterium]
MTSQVPTYKEGEFQLRAKDGTSLFVRSFLPEREIKAVVQVMHGMAEHSARYARLAAELTRAGYAVYADDHRGHGRTAPRREDLGSFGDEGGWERVVGDELSLLDEIKARHPGVPVFLLGHSMGSYIARSVAIRRGADLAGLIISGTSHDAPGAYRVGQGVAWFEQLRHGKRGTSALLRRLTFDRFNQTIDAPRTDFDWLSRDPAEVDRYIADPLCGFECSTQLWRDVFQGMIEVCTPDQIAKMPHELPVYVIAGDADPMNNRLADIRKLQRTFAAAGIAHVQVQIYPGGRHEMFNETNRDQVTRDLLAWLDAQLAEQVREHAPAAPLDQAAP